VTGRSYTPSASQASGVDQIAKWVGKHPERTGVYAFLGARLMERDQLCYRTVFDRIMRAAVDAGRSEAAARTQVYRGFAFAAAGYAEPPPELSEDCD
jgi:hypothetical protein